MLDGKEVCCIQGIPDKYKCTHIPLQVPCRVTCFNLGLAHVESQIVVGLASICHSFKGTNPAYSPTAVKIRCKYLEYSKYQSSNKIASRKEKGKSNSTEPTNLQSQTAISTRSVKIAEEGQCLLWPNYYVQYYVYSSTSDSRCIVDIGIWLSAPMPSLRVFFPL